MVCKNCGAECPDNTLYCEKCGANLPRGEQQAPSQQSFQQSSSQVASAKIPGKGFAVASLVLGIVSFFCFAFVTGILAIIFGAVARNKGYKGGMATAGIVCGIIGLALWIVMMIFLPSSLVGIFSAFNGL